MYKPFETLPPEARIWIYQADRNFTEKELQQLEIELKNFINSWQTHGKEIKASYEIKYGRFIVIAADGDYNAPSGCSIDASVHFIQQLENKYNVILLDKMNVAYWKKRQLAYTDLKEFRKMARGKMVNRETVVFNNLVTNIKEYQNNWEVTADQSWHNRFFK